MHSIQRILFSCALLTGLALACHSAEAAPPKPTEPVGIGELIHVQSFKLTEASTHDWRVERPEYTTGYLIVIEADNNLLYPYQTEQPVLYVGNQTAERVNVGFQSGHLVAIVPAVTDLAQDGALDLNDALIWFGTPEMPEKIDARRVEAERTLAANAGIAALPQAMIRLAEQAAGKDDTSLRLSDKNELIREAMRLVEQYSPQEQDLVDGVLRPAEAVPVVR